MKLTMMLILINLIIFLITVPNLEYYLEEYGFNPNNFLLGRYEIMGTAMFLHASFSHFLFNMIALFLLGTALENKVKDWQYLLVYLSSGLIGNLTMLIPFLFSLDDIGVGASGAISGLVGLGTFLCPGTLVLFQSIIPLPFVVVGAIYFLSTAMNLFMPSQIAYPVHLFGMLVGAFFGLMWAKKRKKNILIFIITLVAILLIPYIIKFIFS